MTAERVNEIYYAWVNMARNGYKDQRGYFRFGQYFLNQPGNEKIVDSVLFNMEDSNKAYGHVLENYVDWE